MKILASADTASNEDACCRILPVFKGESGPVLPGNVETQSAVEALVSRGALRGADGELHYFPGANVLLTGLGESEKCTREKVRRTAGASLKVLQQHGIDSVRIPAEYPELASFAEALELAGYRHLDYKTPDPENPLPSGIESLTVEGADDAVVTQVSVAVSVAESVNWARDLGNAPGNGLTPSILAAKASEMAAAQGLDCEILDEEDMEKHGMNCLLAVSRGSEEPARLIILKKTVSKDAPTIALVGKGLTFDAGGISIKPSAGMEEMKYDMCGAAAALGAIRAIASLNPTVNVVAAVPSSENLPDGKAVKPGDIVTAFNGKTVEIYNTDAEGRLILADALAYIVATVKPDRIIDLATLTGACVVALGHSAAGMLGTDDRTQTELVASGERTGDRVWPLPLWDDYCALIKGKDADIRNMGVGRDAGTITAAAFLKNFVGETPWTHLDIAGTAWGPRNISYLEQGFATGFGVRLLTDWVMTLNN